MIHPRAHAPVHQWAVDVEAEEVEALAPAQERLAGHVRGDGELERGAEVHRLPRQRGFWGVV